MHPIFWGIIIFLAITMMAVVVNYIIRAIGFACQFCDELVVKSFDNINRADQEVILAYFRDYEHREPDELGIFVCLSCRTVYDDFSGERASRSHDKYGCNTFCKVCGVLLYKCELDRQVICSDCRTKYQWQEHEKSGFRFFMPEKGAKIMLKAPSYLESGR